MCTSILIVSLSDQRLAARLATRVEQAVMAVRKRLLNLLERVRFANPREGIVITKARS
jgi:macrodomain Ter protein organizer (MatP/YcbG family)